MQARLASLGSGSSSEPYVSGAKTATATTKPAATKAKAAPPPRGSALPETDAAKDARLRRLCEKKPSGRCGVPEALHMKWKNGSREERDELVDMLESVEWQKDIPYPFYPVVSSCDFTIMLPKLLHNLVQLCRMHSLQWPCER